MLNLLSSKKKGFNMKKKFLLGLLICLAFQGAVFANDSEKGYISSRAEVKREFSPELAVLKLTVEIHNKSPKIAADKNKAIANKVIAVLTPKLDKSKGDFIKSSYYSVSPHYSYKNDKQTLDYYKAIHTITLETSKIDEVGSMIDLGLDNGITKVSNVYFKLKDTSKNCSELLKLASEKAKNEASSIISSVGSKIVGVKRITYSCSPNNYYPRLYKAARAMGANMEADSAPPPTKIETSNINLRATVDADFYVGDIK